MRTDALVVVARSELIWLCEVGQLAQANRSLWQVLRTDLATIAEWYLAEQIRLAEEERFWKTATSEDSDPS